MFADIGRRYIVIYTGVAIAAALLAWMPGLFQAPESVVAAPAERANVEEPPVSVYLPIAMRPPDAPTATVTPTTTPTTTPTATPTATPDPNQLRCNPSGGSGGLAPGTHAVTIAGKPATVIVGDGYDPSQPTFLAYYLHGDGGNHQFHSNQFNVVNRFVRENGWVYVAPQAPQVSDGYHPWHGPDGVPSKGADDNVQQIVDVLNHMLTNYNVCRDVIFGSGASGGSWFYDVYFYPNQGGNFPAFFNLDCGSGGISPNWGNIYTKLEALSKDAAVVRRTEFKYTIGTKDFLYDEALVSVATLTNLGFTVLTDYLQDVTHCGYSTSEKTRDYWQQKSSGLSLPDKP